MEMLTHRPAFLILVFVLILAEIIWRTLMTRKGYNFAESAASLGVALGDGITRILAAGVIGTVYNAVYARAPLHLPLNDWRVWLACFFLVEFFYYWMHRWSHEVRWLWATHAVHHSAHELVLPSALRLGWTGVLSGGWLVFTPLVLAGFSPVMIAALLTVNLAYQFVLHTELIRRLGPVEWVLNTPSHHRVHHASNAEYLDKNYGGVLIVYDRLFGTFTAERAGDVLRYGLVHDLSSKNPVTIALHEWGRMARAMIGTRSVLGALKIAVGRPQ